jgi:putative inorganic carbon (HCO3(-)) transporter
MGRFSIGEMKKHFDLVSIGALVLLGPLFIFPKEKWNWILLAVVVGFILGGRWIIDRRFLPRTPIDGGVALLLAMAFVGVFRIKDMGGSAGKMAGLIYGLVVFYMLIEVLKSVGRMKVAVVVLLAAGLGLAVIGTLGRGEGREAFIAPVESKLPKIPLVKLDLTGAETGVNPNPLGGVLLLFIPIGIMQFPLLLKKHNEYASFRMRSFGLFGIFVLLGVQGIAVVLSASFGTWFALALALWLMGVWKRPLKVVIAGLIFVIIVFSFLKTGEPGQIGSVGIRGIIDASVKSRVDMWKVGLEAAGSQPLFGIGMDQLRRMPNFLYENSHAHNQFLHTAAELGILGLIAYSAILIGVFWMTGEVRRSALPEWMRLTSRGLGTGVFAFTLFGLGDAIPLGAKPGIFFWISLAMITSIYLYGRDNGLLKKNA